MHPGPPPLLHIVRVHRVRHPGKPDPWEAGGGAGLDGRGAAEEDEARAVSLRWRDEGERVPAAVPRRGHHPRPLPRRPHPPKQIGRAHV